MRGADMDAPSPAGAQSPEPYNSDPYYGTQGVASSLTIPGGRNSSAFWTDTSGSFWLFGGDGLDGSPGPSEGLMNDLWKFSPSTNEWTWIGGNNILSATECPNAVFPDCGWPGVYGAQGTPATSNIPGGRKQSVTWTDSKGNLWLFGGWGLDSLGDLGNLNDLWEFSPSTNQWTWVSGSNLAGTSPNGQAGVYGTQGVPSANNVPPGLSSGTGWIDASDNLWLFGGNGDSPTNGEGFLLNNLWEFNTQTREWTWVNGSGSGEVSDPGVYGTMGVAAATNVPSGRQSATGWTDSHGNLWLFGGYGEGTEAACRQTDVDWLNDLWMFNMSSKEWTWMGGNAGGIYKGTCNMFWVPGSWGAVGVAAASNVPSGRGYAAGWADSNGNLWLFGGDGADSANTPAWLNDLWKYNIASGQWTWVSGTNVGYSGGVYGVAKTPAAGNMPGGRYSSASWMDLEGNLWIFAGTGTLNGVNGGNTTLNDLWRYRP